MSFTSVAALWLGLSVAPAQASGDLSGSIADELGAVVEGIEVRVWSLGTKGWEIRAVTYSDLNGDYAFTGLPAADYLLDARMGPTLGPENYADRWYDLEPPSSDGWLQVDADVITIGDGATLTGYDFVMLVFGGIDGCVADAGSTPVPGLRVRVEQVGERRIHHNDLTQLGDPDPTNAGCFYMRGVVPSGDYRVILSDPAGVYETVVLGPFTITSGAITDAGQIVVSPDTAVDPYEDNDSAGDANADNVDGTLFQQTPPQSFSTVGAFIGPVDDPDFFCFQAGGSARFQLNVTGLIDLGGGELLPHPFFDPVVGWWSDADAGVLATNDDAALGTWDAQLVVEVPADGAGRYCALVSTYPDVTLTGAGQGSAGTYVLDITPLNRRPTLTATYLAAPAPVPPATITVAEGDSVVIDLTFSDPDGDSVTVTAAHADNAAGAVTEAQLAVDVSTASWTWQTTQVAARGSPYTVTFEAADAQLAATIDVIIEVADVNVAPTLPVHVSPADGAATAVNRPALRITNSTDVDLDPLVYEFELYEDAAAPPTDSESVAEDPSGETVWTPQALLENTRYTWRVRAFDGHADNPYSPWTTAWSFFVDVTNEPPAPPVMTKPDGSQILLVRDPTLVALNPADPEGDPMQLVFEVGLDPDFNDSVVVSPQQTVDPASTTTAWRLTTLLDWSTTYYARAWALDDRGGRSDDSNVLSFSLRQNRPPPTPVFFMPYDANCDAGVDVTYPLAPIVVINVVDPDGDPVRLDLEIYEDALGPDDSSPVSTLSLPQSTGQTTRFIIDSSPFVEGTLYMVRVRADDAFEQSDWDVCRFIAAGERGGGGTTGGCNCRSGTAGLGALLAGGLLLVRRRRR